MLVEKAPAKVNLTLRVLGRRADGYHELESLVAFAAAADVLRLTRGPTLSLRVSGPTAPASGSIGENLVLKAAHALAARIEGLTLGKFALSKRLPVAAGLGGGSSDAAAALRLLARANGIAPDDPRLLQAARVTGADVPVCLAAQPRLMRGIGDVLSDPLRLPRLDAILINPGIALPTREVFAKLRLAAGAATARACSNFEPGHGKGGLIAFLAELEGGRNDLETTAVALAPVIADVLAALRSLPGARVVRMSGSGPTCFALFESGSAARAGARALRVRYPNWWVRTTVFSGAG